MIYLNLFVAFVKIGFLGFGGGLAIVRLIYDSIQPFMTISSEQFANIVAISQVTPGPLATNVATYVGYEAGGFLGAAIATLGVALPEFILITIVCHMLKKFQESRVIKGMLTGIRPAVIGLIGAALVTLAPPAVAGATRIGSGLLGSMSGDFAGKLSGVLAGCPVDIVAILMVVTAAVIIAKFKKSPIAVLLIMGCIGALLGV